MKTKTKIFNILFGMLICMAPAGGFAAEDIECGYFNPAFGLCSVHSHNVKYVDNTTGMPTNPTKSEDVALMNEVIALKSTVIAQQLKEQYDQLNAIIKRFKTQLEKAVLTSKIEVATGNAASGNTGGGSSYASANRGLANANDCSFVEYDKVFDCLMGNLQKVQQAADSDTVNARKQLEKDLGLMSNYSMCTTTNKDGKNVNSSCNADATDYQSKCGNYSSGRKQLQTCAQWLWSQVNIAKNNYSQQSRSYNQRWQ